MTYLQKTGDEMSEQWGSELEKKEKDTKIDNLIRSICIYLVVYPANLPIARNRGIIV